MTHDSSSLCVACGLCCNGVLHHSVEVRPDEVARVRGLGLAVEPSGPGAWTFPQPCAAHRDDRCGVYSVRPQKCEAYRCALLQRVEDGELAPDDARAIVGTARTLLAECREHVAGDGSWRSLQAAVAGTWDGAGRLPGHGAARRDNAVLSATVAALDVLLQKHFRLPRPGGDGADGADGD